MHVMTYLFFHFFSFVSILMYFLSCRCYHWILCQFDSLLPPEYYCNILAGIIFRFLSMRLYSFQWTSAENVDAYIIHTYILSIHHFGFCMRCAFGCACVSVWIHWTELFTICVITTHNANRSILYMTCSFVYRHPFYYGVQVNDANCFSLTLW